MLIYIRLVTRHLYIETTPSNQFRIMLDSIMSKLVHARLASMLPRDLLWFLLPESGQCFAWAHNGYIGGTTQDQTSRCCHCRSRFLISISTIRFADYSALYSTYVVLKTWHPVYLTVQLFLLRFVPKTLLSATTNRWFFVLYNESWSICCYHELELEGMGPHGKDAPRKRSNA